jgi:ribosomal-protein-alanine N-acetyltransferase
MEELGSIRFVDFEKAHFDGILEVERESFPDPFTRETFEQFLKEENVFIVALEKEKVVGYIFATIFQGKAEVVSVAVKNCKRGMGVGYNLFKRLEQRLKELGVSKLFLEVRVSNKAAQKLYAKLGFKQVSTIKSYYADGEDAVLMSKELMPLPL